MSLRPFRNINRKKTRVINVGDVKIGGDNPISVQSMTNTLTTDVKATINQINNIAKEGADITITDTTISVPSTKGFPSEYGLLKINDEIISYTGITSTSFTGCIRGFAGITSFSNPDEPEEFVFSTSKAAAHAVGVGTSGGQVNNLSALFFTT